MLRLKGPKLQTHAVCIFFMCSDLTFTYTAFCCLFQDYFKIHFIYKLLINYWSHSDEFLQEASFILNLARAFRNLFTGTTFLINLHQPAVII